MEYKQICQIILNVTIISSFIGIFFFTYASTVEKQILEDQSKYIAETMADNVKNFIPGDVKQDIVKTLNKPDLSQQDKDAEDSNKKLRKKALIVLGTLFIVGIIATFVVSKIGNIGFHIVKEAIVILFFVALTEFLFLNIITRNYKVADPNFVTSEMLKSVRKVYSEDSCKQV